MNTILSDVKGSPYEKMVRLWPLLLLAVMVALLVVLCVDLFPVLTQVVRDSKNEQSLTAYFARYGYKAVPILISLQIICVILTVIPDSPVQVLAGICYGVLGGMAIALVGYVLGNLAVFAAVRLFHRGFPGFASKRRHHRHKKHAISLLSIQNSSQPNKIAFLLYLKPRIPSGPLPYLFAQSKIRLPGYLLCMAAGAIPSMLVTTLIGKMIDAKQYTAAIGIGAVYLAVLLAALLAGKKLVKKAGLNSNDVQ